MAHEVALLGGGCFWCLETVYDDLQGVVSVESGYAGGHVLNPTYEQVCAASTGHAEVIRVTFDNSVISFRDVLTVFFVVHDPTTLNRQGGDVGPQYRSVIFYTSDEQKQIAQQVMAEMTQQGLWPNKIVTELSAVPTFYIAEDYHQEYYRHNPNAGYCQAVIAPKVAKFRKTFLTQLKTNNQQPTTNN